MKDPQVVVFLTVLVLSFGFAGVIWAVAKSLATAGMLIIPFIFATVAAYLVPDRASDVLVILIVGVLTLFALTSSLSCYYMAELYDHGRDLERIRKKLQLPEVTQEEWADAALNGPLESEVQDVPVPLTDR